MEERYRIDYNIIGGDYATNPNNTATEQEYFYTEDTGGDFSNPELFLELFKDREKESLIDSNIKFDDNGDEIAVYDDDGEKIRQYLNNFRIRHEFDFDGEWMTAAEIADYETMAKRRTLHVPDPLNN